MGCMAESPLSVEDLLGPDGLFARRLPGFEFRPAQLDMARLIEKALAQETPALIEAGTGTGKTFGYLVPVILSRKKTVISTGTKTLQEQIFFKDLEVVRRVTGWPVDAVMMKGRQNYLCRHRTHQFLSQPGLFKTALGRAKERLETWIEETCTGDRAELAWLADDDPLWDAVCCKTERCLGAYCLFQKECFLGQLRGRAAQARLIVVNHHLFFADLKVKQGGFGEVIPRFQAAVFDEAHELEQVATLYIGETLSTRQLKELVRDLEPEATSLPHAPALRLRGHINGLKAATARLAAELDGEPERGRLAPERLADLGQGPLGEIIMALKGIQETLERETQEVPHSQGLCLRTQTLGQVAAKMLEPQPSSWITWYDRRARSLALHVSPLEVAAFLREELFGRLQSVVLTSATLAAQAGFTFIRSRLGLDPGGQEGICPSPFDFERQALLYVPPDLPDPRSSGFLAALADRVADLLAATGGRALVLFTSHQNLNGVHRILKDRLPYTLLRQGDAPRSLLLQRFKSDLSSVLLATGSFWQGVDVPGEALSALIIDKLPFDSPGDPLVGARIEIMRSRGENPFMHYQLPAAMISLKQGLGRLIRTSSDCGLLAVLDTRLVKRRYGRLFLESLPPVPLTNRMEDVFHFFKKPRPESLASHGGGRP